MRRLTLNEHRATQGVLLSAVERDDLRRVAPSVAVAPTLGVEGRYDLTPSSTVGAINLGSLAIDIQPKLRIDRLLFLLSYALDPAAWEDLEWDYGAERGLHEAMIPAFLSQVRRAFRPGMLQGYRTEEAALATVRGRIRFDEQIRDRFAIAPPIEVRFDEFTEDIDCNRLIKAAIHRLGRLPIRSRSARAGLRAFDGVLSRVKLVEYQPRRMPTIAWSRLNERYRPAVELAKLIIRATSVELRHGDRRAATFLVDMNRLFEDFVVTALRERLRVPASVLRQGDGRLRLDTRKRVRLRPDLSWWSGRQCSFVGDVKYKRVNVVGVLHPDLYQVLAYAIAADLPAAILIYAAGEGKPARHEVVHVGKELHVLTLELDGSPAAVLAQVAGVAERIDELRRSSPS